MLSSLLKASSVQQEESCDYSASCKASELVIRRKLTGVEMRAARQMALQCFFFKTLLVGRQLSLISQH